MLYKVVNTLDTFSFSNLRKKLLHVSLFQHFYVSIPLQAFTQ
jgi:hypothetical protein